MKKNSYTPDFMENANNVYRTKHYIVKQQVTIVVSNNNETYLISNDTYYIRTARRDFEYNCIFNKRHNIDGKRLPSSTYTRKYVD